MVIRDNALQHQSKEDFETIMKSKAVTAKNMDIVSRKLCPDLKYFVCFSSLASGRGNGGQSNYGLANCYLEQLCEKRKRQNLPALAILWGPITETGTPESLQLSHMVSNIKLK